MHQKEAALRNTRPKQRCRKCVLGTSIYIFVLFLLLFVTIFVIVPMAFKYSPGIQQSIIFPTYVVSEKDYNKIEQYKINGVRNFYIDIQSDTTKYENVTLGVWQILPEEMLSDIIENEHYNFDGALANKNFNVLLYLHGNGADRAAAIPLYKILRNFFHIFAVDYRGYADSSKAEMREEHIVNDMRFVYNWLQKRTKSRIFVWGHSLGTGVGTHLVADLKKQNSTPSGLILETPFTSVTDVVKVNPIVKVFSIFPWAKTTILDPLVENGLDFNSKKYILDVDCPIMILHAKDDSIIPVEFATELYNVAINNRNYTYQGNVTYHLYEALGYDHMEIYKAPELPVQISEFVKDCIEFERKKENL